MEATQQGNIPRRQEYDEELRGRVGYMPLYMKIEDVSFVTLLKLVLGFMFIPVGVAVALVMLILMVAGVL